MTEKQITELEREIAELKRRWPPHSASPEMMAQLDELEEALDKARKAEQEG